MRKIVFASAAVLAFTLAVAPRGATAMPSAVAPAKRAAASQLEPVRYVCGPYRCYWQPSAYYRPYYYRPAPFYYRPYSFRPGWACGPYRCWRRW